MEQGRFYFITDKFFEIHDKEKKLMQNKETVDGISANRPCFYAFPDGDNPSVLWCVPVSSKIEKYKAIYAKKLENQRNKGIKHPKCNTIRFGEIMGRERAFLIQNMFPVTQKYIDKVYINRSTNSAVRISEATETDIITNAMQVLRMVFRGYANLVFSDVIRTYKDLCSELGYTQPNQKPKKKPLHDRIKAAKKQTIENDDSE